MVIFYISNPYFFIIFVTYKKIEIRSKKFAKKSIQIKKIVIK